MKIRTLQARSFGKFRDFSLELKDGFNLIFGPNEAGKSTLLTFIEFMLFGSKKDGHNRKYYLDAHENYQPWHSNNYEGSLQFVLNNSSVLYEVYRDFHKDNDKVTLHDANTGKDLSNNFSRDKRDELLFVKELVGLTRPIFLNTIMVPQLALKDGIAVDDGNKELSTEIIRAISGASNDTGAENAMEFLEKSLTDEIGKTDRGKRSGELIKQIETLQEEKQRAEQHRKELQEMKLNAKNIEKRLKTLEKVKADLEQKQAVVRKQELESIIQNANTLKKGILEARSRAEEYIEYQKFNIDLVEDAAEYERRKNDIERRLQELEQKEKSVRDQINALNLELSPLESYIEVDPKIKQELIELKYQWVSARKDLEAVENQIIAEEQKNRAKLTRYEELQELFSALGEEVDTRLEYLESELRRLDQEMIVVNKEARELAVNSSQNRSMTVASTFFGLTCAIGAVAIAILDHTSPIIVPFLAPILSLLASCGVAGALYFRRGDSSLKQKFDDLESKYNTYLENRRHALRERSTVFSLAGVQTLKEFYALENEYVALREEMRNSPVQLIEKRLPKLRENEKKTS
jgi:DNA repair exonuclease SbcCD ATPase subunit